MPRPDGASPRRSTPWTDLALMLAASRAALLAVGLLSASLMSSGLAVQRWNLVYHTPAARPLEIWARWDAEWYLLIAERGYDARDYFHERWPDYEPAATAGFLPLYPLLIRALSWTAPPLASLGAGLLIANLSLFASLLLLYRMAAGEGEGGAGRARGLAACAALLLHPMSLFLSAIYAESLFLALSLGCLLLARRGRLAAGGACGALAALTRPFGALLALPLAWEWWRRRRDGAEGRPAAWEALACLLPPAALGGFMIYCGRLFGDPMAFVRRQERWRGGTSGPWRAFARWWEAGPVAHGTHGSTLELILALVFLAMLPLVLRRLPASLGLYAAAATLLPLCSTLWSFGRFSLTVFPYFMLIGGAWAAGRRRLPLTYAAVGSALSAFLTAMYANWWWAG